MNNSTIQLIQSMLAPGVMISACALLLLGMNNKYSMVLSRMRSLDDEKRKLIFQDKPEPLKEWEINRLSSLSEQIELLYSRIKWVRNAVLMYSIAVSLFIMTSLFIGLQTMAEIDYTLISLILFLIGTVVVFTAVFFTVLEAMKGFKILTLEVKNTRELKY
jgi:hypothetical protein